MAALYDDWLLLYEEVKEFCSWNDALIFVKANPSTVNFRKGGPLGNTLLHQAAYWNVGKGVLETLKLCGADPNLRNYEGKIPAEMSSDRTFAERIREVFGANEQELRLRAPAVHLREAELFRYVYVTPKDLSQLKLVCFFY